MESEKKESKKVFRSGVIVATLTRNGETARVSFTRRYCNIKGEWENTKTLRVGDLPRAQLVLQKAFEHLSIAELV